MKQLILLLSLALISSSLLAQNSETRQLDNFHGVSASASVDVELHKGSTNKAEVIVKNIELDKVRTEIKNGILQVGTKKKVGWNLGVRKRSMKVIVTYTDDLDYIGASSSADLICHDKVVNDHLKVSASSSGDIYLTVDVDKLEASAASSGDIEIKGRANDAELSASSSGDVLGFGLTADRVKAKASSSGDVEITVVEKLHARASSSGDVTYKGNPSNKDVSSSSGGDVTKD